jgi:hypothetical protein
MYQQFMQSIAMNHDTPDRGVSTNLEVAIRPSCELGTGGAAHSGIGSAGGDVRSLAARHMGGHNRLQRSGFGGGQAGRVQISTVNGFSRRLTKAAIHVAATAPSMTR